MNRIIIHIVTSIVCILMPIIFLVYGIWDSHQPKTGPVGDGIPNYPTIPQLIPLVSCFFLGAGNLPLAIMRYREYIKAQNDREN